MLAHHQKETLQIIFEIEISATPEQVWTQLASIEGMRKWFSEKLTFEMKIGGQFRMEVSEETKQWLFYGKVQKIVPNQELAFTWIQQEVGQKAWPIETLVTFKLTKIENGTKVSLTHAGFDALSDETAKIEYQDHIEGWQRSDTLVGLKLTVEEAVA
jgi:uncharacterized protein YndB with AHSA1/START domain